MAKSHRLNPKHSDILLERRSNQRSSTKQHQLQRPDTDLTHRATFFCRNSQDGDEVSCDNYRLVDIWSSTILPVQNCQVETVEIQKNHLMTRTEPRQNAMLEARYATIRYENKSLIIGDMPNPTVRAKPVPPNKISV